MAILTRSSLLNPLTLAIVAACLSGCTAETGVFRSAGGSEVQIRVLVRDETTREPIEGAAITAETASRDHPFSAASMLSQTGPSTSRGTTDHTGSATLQVLDEREFRIVVWAAGRAPVMFGPAQLSLARGEWMDPELPPGSGSDGRLQAKIAGKDDEPSK